jgi:phage tail sheath protein FI
MPINPTFPGVYIEELPSGVRTIVGAPTSITAFVGYTARGRDNSAATIFNFGDFERRFGGLASDSELSYAVRHFFDNGGSRAVIVRVPKSDAVAATIKVKGGTSNAAKESLILTAVSKGAWANNVIADVDHEGVAAKQFNLTLTDLATGDSERFTGLSIEKTSSSYAPVVINDPSSGSAFVAATVPDDAANAPVPTGTSGADFEFEANGTIKDLKSDKDYAVKLTASRPADKIKDLSVKLIVQGEAVPSSVGGLCRLLERRFNEAVGKALAGASLRVVPSASGIGLRLIATFSPTLIADAQDTVLTVANDVAGTVEMLKLTAPTVNVAHYALGSTNAAQAQNAGVKGADGVKLPGAADLLGNEAAFTGIHALEKTDIFNLMCLPDATRAKASDPSALDDGLDVGAVFGGALSYCEKKRAFLLVDPPPSVVSMDAAADWIAGGLGVAGPNAAAYFPRLRLPDALNDFKLRTFAPCGAVAGLFTRTDNTRGVWKAPAGTDARLRGVRALTYKLNDQENGVLNPLGLNCIRALPVYGTLSWGARTLDGADAKASQWKYVPVRRLALMIEESLFRGTQWVVFEPNDTPLWAQIRLNITAFMHGLFRQGAFQGTTPREAYLVKCDAETTTQADIDRGIVNILVGFAPLKPAEFVIIRIQQLAGQSSA